MMQAGLTYEYRSIKRNVYNCINVFLDNQNSLKIPANILGTSFSNILDRNAGSKNTNTAQSRNY